MDRYQERGRYERNIRLFGETKVITLMEILLKWITPKRDAAEMNNYRRSQQIHFDDLLK